MACLARMLTYPSSSVCPKSATHHLGMDQKSPVTGSKFPCHCLKIPLALAQNSPSKEQRNSYVKSARPRKGRGSHSVGGSETPSWGNPNPSLGDNADPVGGESPAPVEADARLHRVERPSPTTRSRKVPFDRLVSRFDRRVLRVGSNSDACKLGSVTTPPNASHAKAAAAFMRSAQKPKR